MKLLLDTCILIDVLRSRTFEQLQTRATLADLSIEQRPPAISVVTVAELRAGLRGNEEATLQAFLGLFELLPVDESVAARAGDYLRAFHRSHGVELGDALVAATATVSGRALWTHNAKHFPMDGLMLWQG